MSDDLVKRLRDWEHVWPQDLDEPEGGLYLKAANRIEELKAKLAKAVEALGVLIQLAHDCEKELTEELHRQDFCGESLPLTNARTTLAELKGEK